MRSLRKMDEGVLDQHAALNWTDACYYLVEFYPGKRYGYTPNNDLVKNLKRPVERSDVIALKRKEWAIRNLAYLLRPALDSLLDFAATTFVPIPPSKVRGHPDYDDRVSQLLRLACPADADIREMIVCRQDRMPAHYSGGRPSMATLLENFALEEDGPVRERIVLFDDVVTSGNHFVACRKLLQERFPGHEVMGVFVARRVVT